MSALKASKSIQHGTNDRRRMEAAQSTILDALNTSNMQAPRVLEVEWLAKTMPRDPAEDAPSPTLDITAGDAISSRPPWRPFHRESRETRAQLTASVSTSALSASAPTTPAHRPGSALRPPSAVRSPGVISPMTVGGFETASRLSRVASAGALRPIIAASPSNLAPDNSPPIDPHKVARDKAAQRARALWTGLELLIYGEVGNYARALHTLYLKLEDDQKTRAINAKAYSIMAVGGHLDEETLVNLAVRAMQRKFRKKRNARLEALHRKAEHTATIAILSAHRCGAPIGGMTQLSRRRGREHLALVERVAAQRILSFFRSAKYSGAKEERRNSCIEMQSKARRYLAVKRISRVRAKEIQIEAQKLIQTVAVPNAERYARIIQTLFFAHRQTKAAKRESFESQTAAFAAHLQAEYSSSPGALAVLAAMTNSDKQALMVRREIAISAGALPGSSQGSARPVPITPDVTAVVEEQLRDKLRAAVSEAQRPKETPAAPRSVLSWGRALEARGRLEGSLVTLKRLQTAWPDFAPILGQVALIEQQLRAPPPPPPKRVPADNERVLKACSDIARFAQANGSASICDSLQAARYADLMRNLALQRQEALKVALRLEFCHQLRGMRKRHTLVRMCQKELDELTSFKPTTVHPAAVRLWLRPDDWKAADPPPLHEEILRMLEQELRDWYALPPELSLSVELVEAEKNALDVRVDLFSTAGGASSPNSGALTNAIQDVLDRFEATPPRAERDRLPELAAMWGCNYVGLEVQSVAQGRTEVHPEPTLSERVMTARADYAAAQKDLDAMGASNRTQKWANDIKWHFIQGSASWLKGVHTPELERAISSGVQNSMPSAAKALEKKVASRMRWEAVKSLAHVQAEQAKAEKMKAMAQVAVEKQKRAAAQELLASLLLEASYATLPELPWRSEGNIDIRWNLGLPPNAGAQPAAKGEAPEVASLEYSFLPMIAERDVLDAESLAFPEKRSPRKSVVARDPSPDETTSHDSLQPAWGTDAWDKHKGEEELSEPIVQPPPTEHLQISLALSARTNFGDKAFLGARHAQTGRLSQLCYYCAGGRGGPHRPVSGAHPMCECPMRMQHGCREYPPEALELVRNVLNEEAEILNRAIVDQATNAIEANLSRKGSYQLGGVYSCVATARQRHLPWAEAAVAPPPPLSTRPSFLEQELNSMVFWRTFWFGELVAAISRYSRVSGYARLSDFKGLAVLQTMPGVTSALAAAPTASMAAPANFGRELLHRKWGAEPESGIVASASRPPSPTKTSSWRWAATPKRVLEAAEDLGLLYGMVGSVQGLGGPAPGHTTRAAPYKCIWLAAAYALAPLPALWTELRLPPKVPGGPARRIWRKSESGRITDRETHPLRDAYRVTCGRCIAHSPHISLKQRPHFAWVLFSVDNKPRCVDMRHAAKRAYKQRQTISRQQAQLQRSSLQSALSTSMKASAAADRDLSPHIGAVVDEEARSEAAGLSVCTFPPVKGSAYKFAPQPSIEHPAKMLAETSSAAIEHAAIELAEKRQAARELGREQRLEAAQKAQQRANLQSTVLRVNINVYMFGGVRVSVSATQMKGSMLADRSDSDARRDSRTRRLSEIREEKTRATVVEREADELEHAVCVFEQVDQMRISFDGQRAQSLKGMPRSLDDVLVMASYLGLPYGGDVGVEVLWIADAALCPILPIGWVRHEDADSAKPFYQHVASGETMWEHPQISFLRGAVAATNAAAATLRRASPAAAAMLEKRALDENLRLGKAVD